MTTTIGTTTEAEDPPCDLDPVTESTLPTFLASVGLLVGDAVGDLVGLAIVGDAVVGAAVGHIPQE